MAKKRIQPKRTLKSYDDFSEYLHYQQVELSPAQQVWPSIRDGFIAGSVTRTKAQRAFRRAFPEDCTEGFDGICRCRYGK